MGIIDRVRQEQEKALVADMENSLHEQSVQARLQEERLLVVRRSLEVFANGLDEPFEEISGSFGSVRYYQLGDVVIMLQRFLSESDSTTVDSRLLEWHYCAYLMAVDNERRKLVSLKIGTLKFLDFSGIAKAITRSPSTFDFRAEAVRLRL